MQETIKVKPWARARGHLMKAWEEVSSACMKNPRFGCKTTGKKCQARFRDMVMKYKEDNAESLRRSGTEEEYDEQQMLLDDVVPMLEDHEENVCFY